MDTHEQTYTHTHASTSSEETFATGFGVLSSPPSRPFFFYDAWFAVAAGASG